MIDDAIATRSGRVVFVAATTFLFDEIANLALTRPAMIPVPAELRGEHVYPHLPDDHERGRGRVGPALAELAGTVVSPWYAVAGAALVTAGIVGDLSQRWMAERASTATDQD